jgi:hypothetical protein
MLDAILDEVDIMIYHNDFPSPAESLEQIESKEFEVLPDLIRAVVTREELEKSRKVPTLFGTNPVTKYER